jgi:hypothetical protein
MSVQTAGFRVQGTNVHAASSKTQRKSNVDEVMTVRQHRLRYVCKFLARAVKGHQRRGCPAGRRNQLYGPIGRTIC